jgi:hypothetical protein
MNPKKLGFWTFDNLSVNNKKGCEEGWTGIWFKLAPVFSVKTSFQAQI